MPVKDMVRVTIEKVGLGVKLIVETEKRGEKVRNLEVETKVLELLDKRGVSDDLPPG